jgi:tetratricopeptide (TPR) repeat protein
MKRLLASVAILSLLGLCLPVLGACATTGMDAAEAGLKPAQTVDGGPSAYGLFLAGQAAQSNGQNEEASSYYVRAQQAGAEASSLKERAFASALFAGDVPRAAKLVPDEEEASPVLARLGQLTQAVENIASGDGKLAKTILVDKGVGYPHRQVSVLLAPWASAAAGDLAGASVRPTLRGDRLVEIFGQLNQALLFERAKRYDEAETNYKNLMSMGDAAVVFAPDYGAFLERRKRTVDALAVYDAALRVAPSDPDLAASRARAAAKGRAPAMLTVRQGASRTLVTSASSLAGEKQWGLALAYLQLAARLDPDKDQLWVQLGDVYTGMEDAENARAAYARIKPATRSYPAARSKLAWSFQAAGDKETALKMAAEAAAGGDRDALITYADILQANEKYAEATAILDKVIGDGADADWRLFFIRGVARERSGDWPGAQSDLLAALKQRPDEPDLLNYLGYSWIDRGERLGEAMGMVQRAVAANPRNGAMIDSLGWAYFRMGDYRNAVEQLEMAVLLEPASGEINDHLGDAYWQVGRQIEARFQWTRVLQLEPDAAVKARAESKLKSGLVGVKPVVASR